MQARLPALDRLANAVRDAHRNKIALEIRGGGTKAFLGGVPHGHPLELGELTGITSYEPSELVVTVRGGTPLAELESVLDGRGQCLPFEPPRFGDGSTVGGVVAAGLSGPARVSAGPLRDYVLGASVLSGTGELLTFGGRVMKNVAGYDVSRLYCGSMGVLGVLCEVSLRVMRKHPENATLCFDIDESTALDRLNRWAALPLPLNASTWHAGRLHVRLSAASPAVTAACRSMQGVPIDQQTALQWWNDVRDHRHEFFKMSDAALDRGESLWRLSIPDTARIEGLAGDRFIEWGGGLLWLRTTADRDEVRSRIQAAGGHASLLRTKDRAAGVFERPTRELWAIHRRLKERFDPAGIFNPGRLYPDL